VRLEKKEHILIPRRGLNRVLTEPSTLRWQERFIFDVGNQFLVRRERLLASKPGILTAARRM
jgi:hypothetical protein